MPFSVATGFPPKEVTLSPASAASDAIKSGDVINVSKSDTAINEVPKSEAIAEPSVVPTPSEEKIETEVQDTSSKEEKKFVPPKPLRPTEDDLAKFESQSDYGGIVRRVMPDDNSCLFHTVAYLLEGQFPAKAETLAKLRGRISDVIKEDDGERFDEITLGKSPAEYARWITQPNSWGGAVELSIFAELYSTEIYALDITSARGNCFGEMGGYDKRVYALFDGIHYDAIVINPIPNEMELDLRQVIPWDNAIEKMAIDFTSAEKKAGHFTNTQSFQILCQQCNTGTSSSRRSTKSEKEAQNRMECDTDLFLPLSSYFSPHWREGCRDACHEHWTFTIRGEEVKLSCAEGSSERFSNAKFSPSCNDAPPMYIELTKEELKFR